MRFVVFLMMWFAVSGLAASLWGACAPGLSPLGSAVSLALGGLVGIVAARSTPRFEPAKIHGWSWVMLACFAAMTFRMFGWVMFEAGDAVRFLSPNNFGDLSLHITFIRYFAHGAAFWPDNPIYAGEPLRYPFGTDLLNALLYSCGMDLHRGLVLVGFLACAALAVALLRWGGGFALAAFLFNGGVAGFLIFRDREFLDYQSDMAWKSIPLAMLVTQRGLLYAMPAGLALLISWRGRLQKSGWVLPLWIELILYASFPLFHYHSFLALSLVLGWWMITRPNTDRLWIARLIGLALVPATILTIYVTGMFGGNNPGIHWKPGWMQGTQNALVFWFENFGVFLPLALFLAVLCWRLRRTEQMAWVFVAPGMLLFLLTAFVALSRWEWDNTKVMFWAYILLIPPMWNMVLRPAVLPVRVVGCVLLFFSGAVSLVGGLGTKFTGYDLIKRKELHGVMHATRELPVSETFVGYPTYNHPVLLSGYKMAMGYPGHLWSYGVNYEPKKLLIDGLMMGGERWRDAARAVGARYLFWGRFEKEKYSGSSQPWRVEAKLVALGEWGAIYDLEPVLVDSAEP